MDLDIDEPMEPALEYQPDQSDMEDAYMEENEEVLRTRNLNYYPLVTQIGLRYGLSLNEISNLINAFLVDTGCTDESQYMSPDKVASMINRLGNYLEKKHNENPSNKKVMVAGSDGKRSDVMLERNQTEILDKQTIIDMANKTYITHISPEDGRAETIANEFKSEVNVQSFSFKIFCCKCKWESNCGI